MTRTQQFIEKHKKVLTSGAAFYNPDTSLMKREEFDNAKCKILLICPTPLVTKTVSSTVAAINDFIITHCPDTFLDVAYFPEAEDIKHYDAWNVPKDKNEHYNRFCYRVMKMKEAFNWFSIASFNQCEIDKFQEHLNNLQNNCGNKIPEKKFKHGGKVGENAVEYDMVHEQYFPQLLCSHYNIPKIYHQLPVGVKQDGISFFAGSKAAIDLWGMNENELTIIELKYENELVGIISELFFYASLMRDIVLGRISKPNAVLSHEKALYNNIEKMSVIHARMLADVYHPLVDYEHVFMLLNDNKLKNVKIDFDKSLYSYIPSTLKFQ